LRRGRNPKVVVSETPPVVDFLGAKIDAAIRLVDLNVPAERIVRVVGEQRANLLEHAVRGLVGDADFSLKLLGADPAASR
jgi:hypothetical protein